MMPSLISCIVPVYNGEEYLRETLGSVLDQTHRPIEILVCDDGSTDRSRAIVEQYGAPVEYLYQAHTGLAAARNLGIRAARGEFVAFVDADDLWHAGKLALQIDRFRQRPELHLCWTYLENFVDGAAGAAAGSNGAFAPVPGLSPVTLLARKEFFERVGLFNPKLVHSSELEWCMRGRRAGAVEEVLPNVLVRRRLHPNSGSARHGARSREEHLHTIKVLLDGGRSPQR